MLVERTPKLILIRVSNIVLVSGYPCPRNFARFVQPTARPTKLLPILPLNHHHHPKVYKHSQIYILSPARCFEIMAKSLPDSRGARKEPLFFKVRLISFRENLYTDGIPTSFTVKAKQK